MNRFDIFLVNLDPTIGREIKKIRPCVIVSPNEINQHLNTIIVAPCTTTTRSYPTRVEITITDRPCSIAVDQIRTVDKQRLVRKLGELREDEAEMLLDVLSRLFER